MITITDITYNHKALFNKKVKILFHIIKNTTEYMTENEP